MEQGYGGMSRREVAAATGMTVDEVYSAERSALYKLRKGSRILDALRECLEPTREVWEWRGYTMDDGERDDTRS
jgi:hypothetical protein